MEIDFNKDFEEFVQTTNGSFIKEIHQIIPTLNMEQQKIISTILFYANKYKCNELIRFITNYIELANKNKDLNFVRSMNFKNLLKYYSMEEYIKGIKVSTQNVQEIK